MNALNLCRSDTGSLEAPKPTWRGNNDATRKCHFAALTDRSKCFAARLRESHHASFVCTVSGCWDTAPNPLDYSKVSGCSVCPSFLSVSDGGSEYTCGRCTQV